MNTLNHYPVTKSIHLFTNQHIVTEPTNHLDTHSIGLVRTRCKCNDVKSTTIQSVGSISVRFEQLAWQLVVVQLFLYYL